MLHTPTMAATGRGRLGQRSNLLTGHAPTGAWVTRPEAHAHRVGAAYPYSPYCREKLSDKTLGSLDQDRHRADKRGVVQGASAQHLRAHAGEARVERPPDFWCRIPDCTKNSPLERFLVQRRFEVEFWCNAATQLSAPGWISPDVRCLLEADTWDGCAEPWTKVLEAMPRTPGALDELSGEERSRLYGMLRLEVAPAPGGFEVSGAFCASESSSTRRRPGRRR